MGAPQPASLFLRAGTEPTEPHLIVLAESRVQQKQGSAVETFIDLDVAKLALGEPLVIPLKKADEKNPFSSMITLGRTNNNDVVLDDPRVSKFHCYFRKVGAGWTICDANSTNGTKVDGVRLPGEHSHKLQSGAKITLSRDLTLLFVMPQDVKATVERELNKEKPTG
jgi:pSer/pThr/pTyr-binding forkhead associated (FHA) protein